MKYPTELRPQYQLRPGEYVRIGSRSIRNKGTSIVYLGTAWGSWYAWKKPSVVSSEEVNVEITEFVGSDSASPPDHA